MKQKKANILPFPRFSSDNHAYAGMTINLNAVVENYNILCDFVFPSTVASVVKADAYGLGVVPVSRALYGAGCRDFFVAYMDEAYELKQGLGVEDARIYVLNGFFKHNHNEFAHEGFIPVLTDQEKVERFHDHFAHNHEKHPCVLHIDTGMNRTGLKHDALHTLTPFTQNMNVCMVISHLACAEDHGNPFNALQKNRFNEACDALNLKEGTIKSLANSGAMFHDRSFHMDMCRSGVSILMGQYLGQDELHQNMQHTFKVWSRIYQIQDIKAGESVGYGRSYTARNMRKIATIAMGYADGCPWRTGFEKGHAPYATIGSHKAPYVGRVSMDLVTLDVTDIPEHYLYEGAVVEIIGKDVSVFDVATWAGTLPYEVALKFGRRLQRNYIEF